MSHPVALLRKEDVSSAAPRPSLAVARPLSSPDDRHGRVVCVAVGNSMVAAALTVTAQRQGWLTRPSPEAGSVLITDRVPTSPTDRARVDAVVLVIEPTPFGARRAVDAMAALEVTAVVGADQPDELDAALACLADERGSVPRRILDLAARMPEVTERQAALLGAVLAGQTTSQMARGLTLSPASVKRELSCLSGTLEVSSRAALFARALELGVRPEPLRP